MSRRIYSCNGIGVFLAVSVMGRRKKLAGRGTMGSPAPFKFSGFWVFWIVAPTGLVINEFKQVRYPFPDAPQYAEQDECRLATGTFIYGPASTPIVCNRKMLK